MSLPKCYNEPVETGKARVFLYNTFAPVDCFRASVRQSRQLKQLTGAFVWENAMTCGIYKITNLKTGEFYIGKSTKIDSRKSQHLRELKLERHHSVAMQNAYNKQGSAYFSFEVLLVCEKHELTKYEAEYIKKLSPDYNTIMAGHPRQRLYIEPIFVNGKEEIAGLEKNWKPKKWHRWVYGDRQRS